MNHESELKFPDKFVQKTEAVTNGSTFCEKVVKYKFHQIGPPFCYTGFKFPYFLKQNDHVYHL
jgi:hypothetical protein